MDKKDNRYYGEFGGQYVSESLMNTLDELEKAFDEAIKDPEFIKQYNYYLKEYVGRETPLYYAERLSEKYGPKIYLKREDLNHTGAHKINNVIGQILLAKRMGKSQSSIANKLRLLNLDELVQDAILNGKISERHARSILKLDNKEDQRKVLSEIIEKRLTVRQTDDLIRDKYGKDANKATRISKHSRD